MPMLIYTPLKVDTMSLESWIDLNIVETFWQNSQKPEFLSN